MDVSMLMHVSERMLNGGKYGIDIFESNPPMILYIYAIPVLAAKWVSTTFMVTCRVFIYLWIIVSLFLSYQSIEKISKKMPVYKSCILLPATAWILLLPGVSFAQREHIMLILIMPYIYLSMASLYGISMHRVFIFIAAIMAGIGFCIKPHFFIPFFIFLLYRRKITIDNMIVISMTILYFLNIVIFYPGYFTKILPLVFEYYYPYFDTHIAWSNIGIKFSLMILMIYGISFYFIKNHKLENVFAIYAIGFIVVYVLQKSNWGYHLYPAIAFVTLLVVQMVYRYVEISLKASYPWMSIFIILFVSLFLLKDPIKYYYLINNEALHFKQQNEFKIIEHLSQLKNVKSVYFLSNNPSPYPAIDYLNLKDVQLIQCYWFFPGMYMMHHSKSQADLNDFRNLIVNDIMLKKPDVIVISDRLFPGSDKNFSLEFFLNNFISKYKKIAQYDELIIWSRVIS